MPKKTHGSASRLANSYFRIVNRKCKFLLPTVIGLSLVLGIDYMNRDDPPLPGNTDLAHARYIAPEVKQDPPKDVPLADNNNNNNNNDNMYEDILDRPGQPLEDNPRAAENMYEDKLDPPSNMNEDLLGPPQKDTATPMPLKSPIFYNNTTGFDGRAPTKCPPDMRFGKDLIKTALFSPPGAGSTWVRHLLQMTTGIYTGSIYSDGELKRRGFLGESHEDTTVIAIKSHDSGLLINTRFPRAIVIYRRPQESILAEYRRRRAGHTGQVDLKGKRLGEAETHKMAWEWRNSYRSWYRNYTNPMHVLHYDDLKSDLVGELTSLLRFLNWEITPEQLECVTRHEEGQFHRQHKTMRPADEDIYTEQALVDMQNKVKEVELHFELRKRLGLPLSL